MTRTPLSRSKGQRSRSPGRFTHRLLARGQLQRWAWERVGHEKLLIRCRLLHRARHFGAHRGRRGAGAYHIYISMCLAITKRFWIRGTSIVVKIRYKFIRNLRPRFLLLVYPCFCVYATV